MTNSERREQIAREVEVACTDSMMTQDGFIHTTLDRDQCKRVVGLIIRREVSLLKVAEAARDVLDPNLRLLANTYRRLKTALDAWQKGRTP